MAEIAPASAPVSLLVPDTIASRLTPAERSIVDLAMTGRPNREIAQLRGSAESTVKHQLVSIYRKLGVDSRTRLMALVLTGRAPDTMSDVVGVRH